MTNIQDKKLKIKQQINKLKHQESVLKVKERKQRTRQLIQLGGLVDKAKLSHLSTAQLLGALIEIKNKSESEEILISWSKLGDEEFKKSNPSSDNEKPIVIKFNEEPDNDIRKKLRSFGMRWNSVRKEWEGISDPTFIRAQLEGIEIILTELETI